MSELMSEAQRIATSQRNFSLAFSLFPYYNYIYVIL